MSVKACLLTDFGEEFFFMALRSSFRVMASPYGALQPHSLDTPHTVWLLWTSDQPNTETSTSQQTTLTRDNVHAPAGFGATVPASGRSQAHALDGAATWIGN